MQDIYKDYETERLVVMYQSTQEEALLSDIIKRNEGLIHTWARSYSNIPNYDEEDLIEEALIACWKAVGYYDPAKGFTFTSCLKGFVKQSYNRIYESATRQKRYTGTTPDSYERLIEVGKDGNVDDRNFTVECEDFKSVEFDELLKSVDFTDKERVIVNILMAGGTNGDCSRELDIKPASVTYYFKQIRKKFVLAYGEM